jgi:biopolymer transport protein ExbD
MIKIKKTSILSKGAIDMTPITDTSFLLLIFFMITTVFKNPSQLKMVLPDARNPVKMEQVKITVEMDAGGGMAINGKTVMMDQVDAYLVSEKNKTQSKSIVIRADQDAKHGDIIKMMRIAKAVGIETISMAVEDLNLKEASAGK